MQTAEIHLRCTCAWLLRAMLRSGEAEQFFTQNMVQEKVEKVECRPSRVCAIVRQTEGLQHTKVAQLKVCEAERCCSSKSHPIYYLNLATVFNASLVQSILLTCVIEAGSLCVKRKLCLCKYKWNKNNRKSTIFPIDRLNCCVSSATTCEQHRPNLTILHTPACWPPRPSTFHLQSRDLVQRKLKRCSAALQTEAP